MNASFMEGFGGLEVGASAVAIQQLNASGFATGDIDGVIGTVAIGDDPAVAWGTTANIVGGEFQSLRVSGWRNVSFSKNEQGLVLSPKIPLTTGEFAIGMRCSINTKPDFDLSQEQAAEGSSTAPSDIHVWLNGYNINGDLLLQTGIKFRAAGGIRALGAAGNHGLESVLANFGWVTFRLYSDGSNGSLIDVEINGVPQYQIATGLQFIPPTDIKSLSVSFAGAGSSRDNNGPAGTGTTPGRTDLTVTDIVFVDEALSPPEIIVQTLPLNSTVVNNGVLFGAATAHEALSSFDGSTSHVGLENNGDRIVLGHGAAPAGFAVFAVGLTRSGAAPSGAVDDTFLIRQGGIDYDVGSNTVPLSQYTSARVVVNERPDNLMSWDATSVNAAAVGLKQGL